MATTPQNLMQTAINGSVTLVSAYVQAGFVSTVEEAEEKFASTREDIFKVLSTTDAGEAPATRATGKATGGNTGAKRGGGKTFTADEARGIDLIFGKFKGITLGEIENMTAEECAEYGYEGKNGEPRTGLQYLKYLANNEDPKASFSRNAATAILEERRASAA